MHLEAFQENKGNLQEEKRGKQWAKARLDSCELEMNKKT